MIRMKKWRLLVGVAAVMTLAACGQKLSNVKTSYVSADVVAVVKGDAPGNQHVTYKAATAHGKVKVDDGRFRITVPTSTHAQTVTVQAGSQKVTRHIKATPALGKYSQVAAKYNQALAFAVLPQAVQAQVNTVTATKAKVAGMPPAQQMAMMQAATKVKQALAQAQTATKSQRLPATAQGQQTVFAKATSPLHLNVQGGQLMSVTIAMTTQTLKSKQAVTKLGMQLELLATATGANAQQVGTQLQTILKHGKMADLNNRTISSQGVKFHIGTTLSELYVFITK